MVIAPGESTTLSLQFTMHRDMEGPHLFRIHLRTNDVAQPEKLLDVRSDWRS